MDTGLTPHKLDDRILDYSEPIWNPMATSDDVYFYIFISKKFYFDSMKYKSAIDLCVQTFSTEEKEKCTFGSNPLDEIAFL